MGARHGKTQGVTCSGDRHATRRFQCPSVTHPANRTARVSVQDVWQDARTRHKRASAADALDLRTTAGELFLKLFKAAIQMIDPLHQCFALSH